MERGGGGGALRVCIVGLGPKGLFALERVLDRAHRSSPEIRMEIDVFEPHAAPGAGPVYDPAQPGYLRMNLAADHLNMWWPGSRSVPAREQLSFAAWSAAQGDRGGAEAGEAYPPRAEVGRYLADGLARMLRHAPRGVSIAMRRSFVRALDELGSSWQVRTANAVHDYDEVLLAVGHGTAIEALPTGSWDHAAPLAGAVFPVGQHLCREQIPPGATVAVRGFALTFLDAALALTEGRGGVFEADRRPHRMRYVATDADAGVIVAHSRSGRPMLAKPEPELAAGVPALEAIALDGRAGILALREGFTVGEDLVAVLAAATGAALRAANGRLAGPEPSHPARAWLAGACDGAPPAVVLTPAAELERSLAVATGLHPPDLPWALGHTWRSVYPAIVARIGGAGLPDREWPVFRRLAAELERLSFGPPPVNAGKLLALVDAGRVDLTHVVAGDISTAGGVTSIRSARGERRVDVVVNAVLAAPGAAGADDHGLLRRLLGDGHARILPGRRGLDVGADAGAVGRDGRPTPGLSVLGRATEDCVIGNDTLSRSMHPHADRWALRVTRRADRHSVAPVLGVPPQGAAA